MRFSFDRKKTRSIIAFFISFLMIFSNFNFDAFASEISIENDDPPIMQEADTEEDKETNFEVIQNITVLSMPLKTEYTVGEALDLTGLTVSALYSDGFEADITEFTATEPANGSVLNTEGLQEIIVSYTEEDITINTSFYINVEPAEVVWPIALVPVSKEIEVLVGDSRNGEVRDGKTYLSAPGTNSTNYFKAKYMANGSVFSKDWFVPGVVLTFYYDTPNAPALNWGGTTIRVSLLQGDTPNNGWINSTVGPSLLPSTTNAALAKEPYIVGNHNTKVFQVTYEALKHLMDNPTPNNRDWDSVGLWARDNTMIPLVLNRVTFGVSNDYPYEYAPWEEGYTAASVSSIEITVPEGTITSNASYQLGINAAGTSPSVIPGKETYDHLKTVKWEIISTGHHSGTTIDPKTGVLKIDLNEPKTEFIIKATSDIGPHIVVTNKASITYVPPTATKTIQITKAADDKLIGSYSDLKFYTWDWQTLNMSKSGHSLVVWGQLPKESYVSSIGYYPDAYVRNGSNAFIRGGSLETNMFRNSWFTPGTVLTLYFSLQNGADEDDFINNFRIGYQKGGELNPEEHVGVPISRNAADKETMAIVDFTKGTIQATYEAYIAAGFDPAWTLWRFSAFMIGDLSGNKSIRVNNITIGKTDAYATAPWEAWDPGLVINPDKPVPAPLPEGRNGIAAKYSLDDGIENDPDVVFFDNFQDYTTGRVLELSDVNKWSGLRLQNPGAHMYIVQQGDTALDGSNKLNNGGVGDGHGKPVYGADNIPGGPDAKAAVYWTNADGSGGNFSIELQKYLGLGQEYLESGEELHTAFIRSYHYWAPNFAITGSSHNGMTLSGMDRRLTGGSFSTPETIVLNGYDWFNTMLEFTQFSIPSTPTPGRTATYIYYPEKANVDGGDHLFPTGQWTTSGTGYRPSEEPNFVARPDFYPVSGQWYCYEFMVQLNTVDKETGIVQRDGRIAAWIDGKLIYDFPNIVIRYTEELMINISRVLLINSPNPAQYGRETYKMITNYVMADSYIGPMSLPGSVELEKIEVTSTPTKSTYEVGEKLNLSGLDVTATYINNLTQERTSTKALGFTTDIETGYVFKESDLGTFTVTVSFTDGGITKETTFNLTVVETVPPAYREWEIIPENYEARKVQQGTFAPLNMKPITSGKVPGKLNLEWIQPGTVFTVYYTTELAPNAMSGLGVGIDRINFEGSTLPGFTGTGQNYLNGGNAKYTDGYLQVTYEKFKERYDTLNLGFVQLAPYISQLIVGTNAALQSPVTITKITIGMVNDVKAPWEDDDSPLASIAVTTPADVVEYFAGDTFDATGMVVTAIYEDETSKPVTDYTLAISGNNAAEGLRLFKTGKQAITVTYEEEGVTKTTTFDVTVMGQKVYKEYDFDLSGRLTTYPNNFYYTILDKMIDGETFDKSWFTDGTIITVYYDTTGASANPDLRLSLLANMIDKNPDTYNPASGSGKQGNQFRIQSTYDLREVPNAPGAPTVGRGLVYLNGAAGTARTQDTLQGTYEGFWRERSTRPFLVDDSYDYLCVFSGNATLYNNFKITRVTIGVTDPNLAIAPWEQGYEKPMPTRVEIIAPSYTLDRGKSMDLEAIVVGDKNVGQGVIWEVLNSTYSTVSTIGTLSAAAYETEEKLTVRATSLADKNIYAEVEITLVTPQSTLKIPAYAEIRFNFENRTYQLSSAGNAANGAAISRSTLINNSTAFNKDWFRPGSVATFYFTTSATEEQVLTALTMGLSGKATSIGGTNRMARIENVSTNAADSDASAILDWTPRTITAYRDDGSSGGVITTPANVRAIQVKYEAFIAAGGILKELTESYDFDGITAVLKSSVSTITIQQATLGWTDPNTLAPWQTETRRNPNPEFNRTKADPGPLPTGSNGLAKKYPNDKGIENDANVVFADDFSTYTEGRVTSQSQVNKWTSIRLQTNYANMFIVDKGTKAINSPTGIASNSSPRTIELDGTDDMPSEKAAVLWTNSPIGAGNFSIELQKYLQDDEALDTVFIRYYQYFAPNFAINGSSHNGVTMSWADRRITNGQWGSNGLMIANGYDFFNVMNEYWRSDGTPTSVKSPGQANIYIYYPGQTTSDYGDHFNANGNGTKPAQFLSLPHFIVRDDFWPENGKWYCYEFMVQMNSVIDGVVQDDGRIASWVDGELIMDFPNLELRYTKELKMNISRALLINSPNSDPNNPETYKMVTNYVMATEYIGPMPTGKADLEDIEITALPDKTKYIQGEKLDLTGLAVTAKYTDGKSSEVTGYTTEPAEGDSLSTVGKQKVTVTYTEDGITKTKEFTVTVDFADKPVISDAEFLQSISANVLKNGLSSKNLVLKGKTLSLVFDERIIILSNSANNKNISGEVDLGGGYYLVFDIKGNGSNVKQFKVITKK